MRTHSYDGRGTGAPIQDRRVRTEHALIDALGALLSERGFTAVGVRSVASRAGVNKTLIYRYFGGLDGLARAYAKSERFWPTIEEVLGESAPRALERSPGERWRAILDNYPDALRKRPRTIEILAWETVERNAVTIALEKAREGFGLELAAILQHGVDRSVDSAAIITVASAMCHYLIVRARKIDIYNGIDINSDAGWMRLKAGLHQLVAAALSGAQPSSNNRRDLPSTFHTGSVE